MVAGTTKERRLRTSSWNSGECSMLSQSYVGPSMRSPPSGTLRRDGYYPDSRVLVRNRSKVDLIDERLSERDERRPTGSMLGSEGGRRFGCAAGPCARGLAGRGPPAGARAAGPGPV